MNPSNCKLLIGNVRVPLDATEAEILKKATDKMKRAGLSTTSLHFRLYKKSVDARKKEDIRFVCTVMAESNDPKRIGSMAAEKLKLADARLYEEESLTPVFGNETLAARPLVVGMGPAGLFAALLLARNGYQPILIDRGASVEERVNDVSAFRATGRLNTESNIQFGAGGAGTFSDGKLITRINDPRCGFVLSTLCEFGAPLEITVQAKPHIGSDLLRDVVSSMLREIQRLGGDVRYHCRLEDFVRLPDGTIKAVTTQGDLHCGAIILAVGHSARDTYFKLLEKNFAMEAKPISVGVRAEHLQTDIDRALYGRMAGHPNLGHAEYALSDTTSGRGVYTFCMCPGGEVVAAASEEERLVVNGMSNHARNGVNANAAVAVSIGCDDIEPMNGSRILGAIAFQRHLEHAAFVAGGKDFYAPIMTLGDFLSGTRGTEPTRVLPSYRDGKVRVSDFEAIFPPFVLSSLKRGFLSFGKKLQGYDSADTVLTAAETRTSAPVRILRDAEAMTAIGFDRVYPCGEGAGYAGGITSAAVDGVRVAMALMARFGRVKKENI
ncbi:MAG: FAD-dependent oxidoreductase [Ruminococcaceae bacterium]|nr:FAD-dependent oxidoreductase [Oscillospiraceae bacterium]